jgi:hypothetical protein
MDLIKKFNTYFMKKLSLILIMILAIAFSACDKEDFSENYANPAKIAATTIDKQYAGFLFSNRNYVLPDYWNYFVVLRTTLTRYTQAVGWINSANQYVPGGAGIDGRWGSFYSSLVQYRELEKVYEASSPEIQDEFRIFMITSTIYLYDNLQIIVDLHGSVPFTDAGRLGQNGGDYNVSLPVYDSAEAIYTKMLDDLKGFADELNSISLSPTATSTFKKQDFVSNGNIDNWRRHCNSLRLRMLTRISNSSLGSRSAAEIASILSSPASYPTVEVNSDNVQIDVNDVSTAIRSTGFQGGLEDWDGNIAGKKMIDHMNANSDPRQRAMFEPGANAAADTYLGLDPLMMSNNQTTLFQTGTVSIYNRSTISRNDYFPGLLITAGEVDLLKAEYYLHAGNDAMAKSSYENAITNSTEFYYHLRTLSNDQTTAGPLAPLESGEIDAYLAQDDVNWDNAGSTAAKLELIATQKWIHLSVLQLNESWAEQRRLDLPSLEFEVDVANAQSQPPYRWFYPDSERANNEDNYQAVSGSDNLTTKLFWDN